LENEKETKPKNLKLVAPWAKGTKPRPNLPSKKRKGVSTIQKTRNLMQKKGKPSQLPTQNKQSRRQNKTFESDLEQGGLELMGKKTKLNQPKYGVRR